MKVLVVGSGGREHALCWALSMSPHCSELFCAPGNPGIAAVATCVPVKADDVDGLVAFAKEKGIEFVVVGPEIPLVLGLVDKLEAAGIKAFGPNAEAAKLEGSKAFMKDVCARHRIPSAAYARFTELELALAYVRKQGAPIVVKASGLAAGKGVTVARTIEEAETAVRDALVGRVFGDSGAELVIEEFLDGEEASFFALCDGTDAIPLISAQDHKAAYDGDKGPNTGGMGAYSPAPVMTPALEAKTMETIILPTLRAMAAEGRPYRGVLFAGLMIKDGAPKLIEYNVRFGDPECQVLMRRLRSDLLPVLLAACEGRLKEVNLDWDPDAALCVVMAAKGYPGSYAKGTEILYVEDAASMEDVAVFHAGTALNASGQLVSAGGRVLCVTALGATVAQAQDLAYEAVDRIHWPDGFCRRDIGWRAIAREKIV